MPRKKRKGNCYLCRVELTDENFSKDHIPPKGIFGKSARNCNLITVPCCKKCNGEFAEKDELFMMALTSDARNSMPSDEIMEKVKKSVGKGGLRRHWPAIKASIGKHPEHGVEVVRFPPHTKDVMERIVKGLFYSQHRIRDFSTYHFWVTGFDPRLRDALLVDPANSPFAHQLTRGNGIFRADWLFNKADPKLGVFWFQFYGGATYQILYMGNPPEDLSAKG